MDKRFKDNPARLDARLAETVAKPGAELSGLALAVIRDGKTVHEACFGRSLIDPAGHDAPVSPDTLFRVASISKTVSALLVMLLADEARLDIERDVSAYLGWKLRNPAWPDAPISISMLLSHTSSLRDGEVYTMPLGGELREFFEPGGRGWENGAHFAAPGEFRNPAEGMPGRFFAYCNLGFGVMAAIAEKVTGERFDLMAKKLVLEPLGMEGSFNTGLLSDDAFKRLAPLYRKGKDGNYDPQGPWIPQVDDYRSIRPTLPCVSLPELAPGGLAAYQPGTNGTFFSPQGGLRASIRDLARLTRCFIGKGVLDGTRILPQSIFERMMTPRWTFDPATVNGDSYHGITRESGLALMHSTGSLDSFGSDRLMAGGGPLLWGHHGDAYGLLGGMLFHPDEAYGFAYLIGGTAEDPEKLKGRHSSFCLWKEEIHQAALDYLLG